MAVELATGYVSILPSTRNFGSNLSRQISGPVGAVGEQVGSDAGRRFSGKFALAAKVGLLAAGAGLALFAKSAISEASDVNESQSKVGVVFGQSSKQIIAASKTSAEAMGLSTSAYLDATGTLGNLLVSLKIAPKAAAGMSQQMVALAGDLASFNNVSPEEALAAIKSGLVGETEPLRAFGVNINQATLQAEALKLGLIKNVKDGLTPQAKALASQALIMDQTKTAQGDFARTSGGLANQQRILAAQFDNVKAKVGAVLLPVMVKLANFATGVLLPMFGRLWGFLKDKLAPIFLTVKDGVAGLISAFQGEGITSGGFVGFMEHAGVVLRGVVDFITSHLGVFKTLALGIAGVTAAWVLLNTVMSINPVVLAVVAIAALVAGLVVAYKRSETFRRVVQTAFAAVKDFVTTKLIPAFKAVVAFVIAHWPQISAAIAGAWKNYIRPALTAVASFITGKVIPAIKAAVAFVVTHWPQIQQGFVMAWQAIKPVLEALGHLLKTIWDSVLKPLVQWVVDHWTGISTVVKVVFVAVAVAAKIVAVALTVAFRSIADAIAVLASVFRWLWNNVVTPVFNAIKTTITVTVTVIKAIFTGLGDAVRVVAGVFGWLWHAIIVPVFNGIKAVITTQVDIIRGIITGIGDVIRGIGGFFSDAYHTAARWIGNIVTAVSELPGKITGYAGKMVRAGTDLMIGVFTGIRSAVSHAGGFIAELGKDIVNAIIDGLNAVLPHKLHIHIPIPAAPDVNIDIPLIPKIPHLRLGGDVKAGHPYVVGDGGRPELFVPEQNGRVHPSVPDILNIPRGPQILANRDSAKFAAGVIVNQVNNFHTPIPVVEVGPTGLRRAAAALGR